MNRSWMLCLFFVSTLFASLPAAPAAPALLPLLRHQLYQCGGIDQGRTSLLLESRLKKANPEGLKAWDILLQASLAKAEGENPALCLLARLAAEGISRDLEGDCALEAIALVNSWYFSVADGATRELIVRDCLDHLKIYDDIRIEQKASGRPWGLEETGLVPKLLWADRGTGSFWELWESISKARAQGLPQLLTEDVYREFVDRPESLRLVRSLFLSKGLERASLRDTAKAIEVFVEAQRSYRSSMENLEDFHARGMFSAEDLARARAQAAAGGYEKEYAGKKRRWDGFNWLNYQCFLYETEGSFQGDCGTTTTVQMAFYRMAGIVPLSLQWIHHDWTAAFTHNFPGYYHPLLRRWFSVQKPLFMEGGKEIPGPVPTFLHYTKPVWHALRWVFDYEERKVSGSKKAISFTWYPGELATAGRISALLEIGIPADSFEQSFWRHPDGLSKGIILPPATSPEKAIDSDYDGLPDILEASLGSDQRKADTDGDGRSDAYELEMGRSPLIKNAAEKALSAVDGIVAAWEYDGGEGVSDPAGDLKSPSAARDIRYFSATLSGDALFCGVRFGAAAASSGPDTHSFLVDCRGTETERFWFQRHNGYFYGYAFVSPDGSDLKPLGSQGLYASIGQDAEFSIDLSWFADARSLRVRYFASGFIDGELRVQDDVSEVLRPRLPGDDFLARAREALAGAPAKKDPKGDASIPGADILGFSIARGADGAWYARADLEPSRDGSFGLRTIHARDAESGMNWWIQWWTMADFAVHRWKDGQEAEALPFERKHYDCAVEGDSLYLRLAPDALGPAGRRQVTFHAGKQKSDGSYEASADYTEGNEILIH